MPTAPIHCNDPLRLTGVMTAVFGLLCLIRFTVPSQLFFDEVHYVPAAKALLEGGSYINREHPLLGKHMIALGIAIFGDNPIGWRALSLIAGMLAFFASARAMWFASLSRNATLIFGFLHATGFFLLIHSRIAMLDIFMFAAATLAAWQFAIALRKPEQAHVRLLLTGIALGAAMGAKWNAIPFAMLPGLAFFAVRLQSSGKSVLTAKRAAPVNGVSLPQAFFYLGVIPLTVYAATFLPALCFQDSQLAENGLIGLHAEMLELQSQVLQPHNYESNWPQWLFNRRAIWYLYEYTDGAQRGVMLIGNPLTMLLGLPALIWCAFTGLKNRNWARIAIAIGFLTTLGLWFFAEKSVQYYYHYFLPSAFLLAALALALDRIWMAGSRRIVIAVLALTLALFAYFFPILTAAELNGKSSFTRYTWIEGWI